MIAAHVLQVFSHQNQINSNSGVGKVFSLQASLKILSYSVGLLNTKNPHQVTTQKNKT